MGNIRSLEPNYYASDPHQFNESAFTRLRFGVFAGDPQKVKLLIKKEMTEFFTNRVWHPSQRFSTKRNGDVILEMNVPLSTELTSWILNWKTYLVALKPRKLVETIVEQIDTMREIYDK